MACPCNPALKGLPSKHPPMDDEHHKIQHLSELLFALENMEVDQLRSLAHRLALDPEEFRPYVTYSEEGYTRNCLARTEDYELLLLGWEPAQATPVHEHNEQECWVHFMEGDFMEEIFEVVEDKPEFKKLSRPHQGQTTYMHDSMGCHRLTQLGPGRGMSLHLYVGPIDECKVYNEKEDCFEVHELSYDLEAELSSSAH